MMSFFLFFFLIQKKLVGQRDADGGDRGDEVRSLRYEVNIKLEVVDSILKQRTAAGKSWTSYSYLSANWTTCQLDPVSSVGSKRCNTVTLSSESAAQNTSPTRSPVFTGFVSQGAHSDQSRRSHRAVNGSAPANVLSYFTSVADVPS